ncbi:hypothetical protein ACFSOZ_07845 [Mesorhizobium newzealandense]|uniref:Uncharacterized protein n=1 Tax=Mesorhizobium newzealandense TaxID=1300302 RepID=A0ABW4U848_9HYPH
MPGKPWEKYQAADIPPGFRVVQPGSAATPRFDGLPVDPAPAADPWAALPDAKPAANVFDQFDAPAAKGDRLPRFPGVPANSAPAASDPWAAFPDAKAQGNDVPAGFHIVASPSGDGPWTKYAAPAPQAANDLPPGFKIVQPGATQVKAPDLPDGTPDDVMAKAMRETFGGPTAQPADQPSSVKDFAYSLAAGVPRGAVEMGMLPVTAARVVKQGGEYLQDKVEDPIRALFGYDAVTPEEKAQREADDKNSYLGGFLQRMFDGQDAIRSKMDENLYAPRTTAGEYGGTIGEFTAPGGMAGNTGKIVGDVIAPAVASEAAGQATEGTPYEGLMRFLGAAFGNAGTAVARSYSAPESYIRRATNGMTDADWQKAQSLQDANKTGIALAGPEAIAQVQGGASALPDLLRVIEGSVEGRTKTAPFFTQRPGQVDTAVGNMLDQIAPQSAQPSTLGPRAAEAAGNVIDQTRQGINAQTRPLYDATGPVGSAGPTPPQVVPQAQFAPIAADPRFQAGLARLRGNAELAPEYAGLPDNAIGVIDAVTKDLNARGEALANVANPLYGPELAGRSRAAASDARNAATTASPEYAQALAEQEALRRSTLNPLEQGPVGKVAAATDTTGAGNALLPHDPLTGSAGEAADAAKRLTAEDPATTAALVRQNLADRHTKAATETQGADRSRLGIKFYQDVAGNDTRRAVLDAVLREAAPQAGMSMDDLLPILHATGYRQAVGSLTAFNEAVKSSLGASSLKTALGDLVSSAGLGLVKKAGDATTRASLRGNIESLAKMFIAPDSVQQIKEAVARGPRSTIPDAMRRTALESGGTIFDPAGQR